MRELFPTGSGTFGRDLRCDCGEGAKDVAPDYEIDKNASIQWTCRNGHLHISGFNMDGAEGKWAQMRFDKP